MDLFNSVFILFGKFALLIFLGINLLLGSLSGTVQEASNATSTPIAVTTSHTASTTVATTTKPKATVPVAKPPPKKKVVPVAPSTPPSAPPTPVTLLPTAQVDMQTRPALVNILCTVQLNNRLTSISGSGVFIDSRGVILTNAHVAQYFLLSGSTSNSSCVIRTGSPAQNAYTAKVLYLPATWIGANASKIIATDPKGTGENDYAFLLVNASTNSSTPLPASFAAVAVASAEPDTNDSVLLAAYPAGFLSGASIQSGLYILSSIAKVGQVFTFDDPHHVDVVSLGGTAVSQSGSSGGAVIELSNAKLTAIIATDTEGTTTASRDLNAITIAHINRSLQQAGQSSISVLLSHDLTTFANTFNQTTGASEKQKLEAVLK